MSTYLGHIVTAIDDSGRPAGLLCGAACAEDEPGDVVTDQEPQCGSCLRRLCQRCDGTGERVYDTTAGPKRGGVGGNMFASCPCDGCRGTGIARPPECPRCHGVGETWPHTLCDECHGTGLEYQVGEEVHWRAAQTIMKRRYP